nr:alpha-amylase family protein [Microbacterium sp. CFH 90308]
MYGLDVEKFADSDGDGIGDFSGLVDRVDYLADLGVTCIWLMPFYPTPDRDDGYDVTDFYGVDPRLGSHGDVVEFLRTARSRGIRVIIDLVVNHTSDRHPWFLQAKRSRASKYRDYYVWRDRPTRDSANTVFPGEEDSVWEWEPRTEQYFLHTFYRHQPDLNLANPHVRDEIAKIIAFWLALGVAGFRIDAVPFLLSAPGAPDEADPHEFLRDVKRFTRRRSSEGMLLGEVGLPHRDQFVYFGGTRGDELDAQFDFTLTQSLFLALARQDARPLERALRSRPATDEPVAWTNFLRNHDELSLEMLREPERQEVFEALAPDPSQRIYGRGIVRRLAPMLNGDPRRLHLAYSLLFSLPGNPVLHYGEEIGMGENPELPGRQAMRTPMQWTPGPNGGFTTAPPSRLPVPFPTGGYAPDLVNVRNERQDPGSLMHFISKLAFRYRSTPEIGWGDYDIIDTGQRSVFAHRITADTGTFVAVHNLGDAATTVTIEDTGANALTDLLSPGVLRSEAGRLTLHMEGYGFRWLRAGEDG